MAQQHTVARPVHPLLKYFNVLDMRDIRTSKRFQEEIEPHFLNGFTLSYEDTNLIVIGKHEGSPSDGGMYYFATNGDCAGKFYRAVITF